MIDSIEIIKKSRARRSKLYYVREKAVRDIRKKMKSVRIMADREPVEIAEVATEETAA